MRKTLLNRIRRILRNRRLRRMMTRVISIVAALVVFVTTYALVLPAITMEREADCGIEAHQHDDSCYERQLVCDIPEDPGHRHDDACYRAESVLKCVTAEHTHGEACYDEEGNLLCEQAEHTHDASCYEEERELICGLEESAGHQHDDSCYENVLVCGKEVHVHSEDCYHQEPVEEEEAYSAEDEVPEEDMYPEEYAVPEEEQNQYVDEPADMADEDPVQTPADAEPYDSGASSGTGGDAGAAQQDGEGASDRTGNDPVQEGGAEVYIPEEEAAPEVPLAAPLVPELEPLDFRTLLNSHTGIYYYHVQPGEIVENSAQITGWKKVSADTELGENDLLRVYLAYTLPAGAVNTTNAVVRYRLPGNLHLTDDQVKAINGTENGIAAQYVDYGTLTLTDPDNYHRYLGAEAVEGSRTPDQDEEAYLAAGGADGNGQEYISAVVRVENIGDAGSGDRTGQDLLFTFVPYTVFKNRHEYDSSGQQTGTGVKVRGWFSLDFNMGQVDFDEVDVDGDREIRTADVVFAEKDNALQIEEIRTGLRLVCAAEPGAEEDPEAADPDRMPEEDLEDPAEQAAEAEGAGSADPAEDGNAPDGEAAEENAAADGDKDPENAEDGHNLIKLFDDSEEDGQKDSDQKDIDKKVSDKKDSDEKSGKDAPAQIMPAMSFEDTIRVSTGRPAGAETKGSGGTVADAADALPKKAAVTVRVEADEGTFPAGTTMVLAAVKDLEAVAETVQEAVENGGPEAGADPADSRGAGTEAGSGQAGKAAGSGQDGTGVPSGNTSPRAYGFQAVDISFRDADGKEIEPLKPVRVAMTSEIVEQVRREQTEDPGTAVADPVVVHIDDDGNVETMDLIAPEEIEPARGRTEEELREEAEAEAASRKEEKEKEAEAADQAEEKAAGETEAAEKDAVDKEAAEKEVRKEGTAADHSGNTEAPAAPGSENTDAGEAEPVDKTETAEEKEEQETGRKADPSEGQEEAGADTEAAEPIEPGISRNIPATLQTVAFRAESFSVYVIVYTVDFEYTVNGKSYWFSLPGGGFVSFTDLVQVLGITGDTNADNNRGENGAETAESADENAGENAAGEGTDENGANPDANTALTLGDVKVSEATRKFVADVASVAFSSPSLVDVSKVDSDTTVDRIKKNRGLECQYSAELTEVQIAEINAQPVEAGDWALISVHPFTSEETLTVTLKDGEVFTIRVTDYQISTNVLTADGKTYKITVTFDDDAEIPKGTKLVVREIEPESDEFMHHLAQAWSEVNREYLEQEALVNSLPDGIDYYKDIRPVNLDDARFFNITLLYKGEPLEPKTAVQVDIQYIDGLKSDTDEMVCGVVHFKENADKSENGIELIDEVETREDEKGEIVEFSYEQDSFSDIGTYVGQETKDGGSLSFTPSIDLQLFGEQKSGTALGIPAAEKKLIPNEDEGGHADGTYTLSLSVTGQAVESSSLTKANVLFIMDRSSSMTGNVYERHEGSPEWGTTYYRQDDLGNFVTLRTYNGRYYYENTWTEYSGPVFIKTSTTRLEAEQMAMRTLIGSLLEKNVDNPGTVEISIISFADTRGDLETTTTSNGTWNTSVTETAWNHNSTTLLNAVNAAEVHSGTNWEEALIYAQEKINQLPNDRKDEKTYVIFLTDGEPTAIHGETGGAHHYDNTSGQPIYNGDAYGYHYDGVDYTLGGFEYAYKPARNDARDIVEAGYDFYTVMTFNPLFSANAFLKRLTNYAYDYDGDGIGADSIDTDDDVDTDGAILHDHYFNASTPEELTDAFGSIFRAVSNSMAHGQVKITDGMTAGAMTSTFVSGSPSGVRYIVSKKDEDDQDVEQYSVTVENNSADADNPVVTFHINGEEYSTTDTGARQVTKVTNPDTAYDKGTYYTVTVDDVEYKMALASIVKKSDTEDTLTWDLTPIGTLWGDCTYTAEFIVWPNQDAYDYVAALNNGIKKIKNSANETVNVKWNQNNAVPVTDPVTNEIIYYMGGCTDYPSIVYYPGTGDDFEKGIYKGTFAVLTNTEQYLDYSVVTKEDGEVTGIVPQDQIPLETPKPMKLTASGSRVSKLWNISRDPDALLRLLYEFDGNMPKVDENKDPIPKKYTIPVLDPETGDPVIDEETGEPVTTTYNGFFIDFNILQDTTNPAADAYKTVRLGWDEEQQKYVWYDGPGEGAPYVRTKTYGTGENTVTLTYGTRWEQDFSIATGLMLTRDRVEALGLNPDDYAHGKFPDNETGTMYYLLEDGHDYTLSEPDLGYEFDFDAPTYHPMLVNGVMKSVRFTKNAATNTLSISKIEDLKISTDGMSLLEIINTLRGYIHVKKVVTADSYDVSNDETKFTYNVNLYNDDGAFTVEGFHIPWYGIDGLFYHTEVTNEEGELEYQYYQAAAVGTETGENEEIIGILTLTDEHGNTYDATCSGAFNENIVGPTEVTFEQDGTPKTIRLYGNQMDYSEEIMETDPDTGEPVSTGAYRKVHATFMINQKQQLNIANVPVSTRYEITESDELGYEFVKIESTASGDKEGKKISGVIVPNSDTEITYTNKAVKGELRLKKQVTINEFDPSNDAVTNKTLADGEYTFRITGKEGTDTAGKSYIVKITISQGAAVSAQIKDNTAETPAFADTALINGAVPLHDLTPGVYTIAEDESTRTLCTAINSTNQVNQTDLDNRQVEITVGPGTSNVNLITFINNYAEDGVTDIAHVSVRKTFKGLSKNELPAGFKINVTVNYSVTENGHSVNKTLPLELTGASDTTHGILWQETVGDDEVVWNWTIAIQGLTPSANVTVQEVNYEKPGYDVTTTGNPTNDGPDSDGTSYSGTVVPSTTIASLTEVITQQNSKVFPVEDTGDEATIFIARLVPSQTALVISKKRLNLNERASLEEMLRDMPNAQDWTNGQTPQYFSFEQAANNEITVRSNFHVTYFEEDGHGFFRFEEKKIWNMVAVRKITYKEGRPADFNFENSYTEIPIDLDVIKVDGEDGSKKLGGAVFALRKLTETDGNPPVPTINGTFDGTQMAAPEPAETAEDTGKTTFAGLTKGYYELIETKAPDGYIMMTNSPVYFRVADGAVVWIEWSAEEEKWVEIENNPVGGMVAFERAQAAVADNTDTDEDESQPAKNAAFVIGNTPGAALPNAGGPGTTALYLLGIMLIALAGEGVVMRKRRRDTA